MGHLNHLTEKIPLFLICNQNIDHKQISTPTRSKLIEFGLIGECFHPKVHSY